MRSAEAEGLAVEVLGFLVENEARIERFLGQTGLAADELRHATTEPGFLAGVLAYLAADEGLLLEFCNWSGAAPEMPLHALAALEGRHHWNST